MAHPQHPSHAPFHPRPTASPSPTPSHPTRRIPRRRASSIASTAAAPAALSTPSGQRETHGQNTNNNNNKNNLLPHYTLAPTVPSPFTGTLDAALDAILEFGRAYSSNVKGTQPIIDALLSEVDAKTAWRELLLCVAEKAAPGETRVLWMELVFLVSRSLLPELVVENRRMMLRLYERKKQLAMRLVLRYDMLRAWRMEVSRGSHARDVAVTVASRPPPAHRVSAAFGRVDGVGLAAVEDMTDSAGREEEREKEGGRRALMPNIIPTLIAAPEHGYSTHAVRERMKHHVTDLDGYLLLTDEEVEGWGTAHLLRMACTLILHWQWLRQNNKILADMEVDEWEELGGKADECEWIADDVKRTVGLAGMGKKDKDKEKNQR